MNFYFCGIFSSLPSPSVENFCSCSNFPQPKFGIYYSFLPTKFCLRIKKIYILVSYHFLKNTLCHFHFYCRFCDNAIYTLATIKMYKIKLNLPNWKMIELENMKVTQDWDHETRAKYGHAPSELTKSDVVSASEIYQEQNHQFPLELHCPIW